MKTKCHHLFLFFVSVSDVGNSAQAGTNISVNQQNCLSNERQRQEDILRQVHSHAMTRGYKRGFVEVWRKGCNMVWTLIMSCYVINLVSKKKL